MSMTEPLVLDPEVETLIEDFEFLDGWEERFRYIIDLGRQLEPMADALKTDATKVDGCTSQVWIIGEVTPGKVTGAEGTERPRLSFIGDSDAHIVRGLVAILLAAYSDKSASEILGIDIRDIFQQLNLEKHLSPSRSNGFFSMVERIQNLAKAATAA